MTAMGTTFDYSGAEGTFEGYLARPSITQAPVVMVAHAWAGPGEHECAVADRLAEAGYVGFVIDVYGKGQRGGTVERNMELMNPLLADRQLLQQRLTLALQTARSLENVDNARIAAIGYCFGGLCVLDLARGGGDVGGVVSFHGLFNSDPIFKGTSITAKVLALHGWDDPMVTPGSVEDLAAELTQAGADWQVHAYGGTMHAFTNKAANDRAFGTVYNPSADRRSWQAMQNFLTEIFA